MEGEWSEKLMEELEWDRVGGGLEEVLEEEQAGMGQENSGRT
jgi:hypothetical protein